MSFISERLACRDGTETTVIRHRLAQVPMRSRRSFRTGRSWQVQGAGQRRRRVPDKAPANAGPVSRQVRHRWPAPRTHLHCFTQAVRCESRPGGLNAVDVIEVFGFGWRDAANVVVVQAPDSSAPPRRPPRRMAGNRSPPSLRGLHRPALPPARYHQDSRAHSWPLSPSLNSKPPLDETPLQTAMESQPFRL